MIQLDSYGLGNRNYNLGTKGLKKRYIDGPTEMDTETKDVCI